MSFRSCVGVAQVMRRRTGDRTSQDRLGSIKILERRNFQLGSLYERKSEEATSQMEDVVAKHRFLETFNLNEKPLDSYAGCGER